eukprot:gene19040-6367_t
MQATGSSGAEKMKIDDKQKRLLILEEELNGKMSAIKYILIPVSIWYRYHGGPSLFTAQVSLALSPAQGPPY